MKPSRVDAPHELRLKRKRQPRQGLIMPAVGGREHPAQVLRVQTAVAVVPLQQIVVVPCNEVVPKGPAEGEEHGRSEYDDR